MKRKGPLWCECCLFLHGFVWLIRFFTSQSTFIQLCPGVSSCFELVLCKDKCVLLKEITQRRRWAARTRGPSVSSQALYHWTTVLPIFLFVISLIKVKPILSMHTHNIKNAYINMSWFYANVCFHRGKGFLLLYSFVLFCFLFMLWIFCNIKQLKLCFMYPILRGHKFFLKID